MLLFALNIALYCILSVITTNGSTEKGSGLHAITMGSFTLIPTTVDHCKCTDIIGGLVPIFPPFDIAKIGKELLDSKSAMTF